jgi:hypothetical protein
MLVVVVVVESFFSFAKWQNFLQKHFCYRKYLCGNANESHANNFDFISMCIKLTPFPALRMPLLQENALIREPCLQQNSKHTPTLEVGCLNMSS